MKLLTIIPAIAIALSGCTTTVVEWAKPNTSYSDFSRDTNYCAREAASIYPIQYSSYGGSQVNTNKTCYTYNNNISCYGNAVASPPITVDINANNRNAYHKNCMFGLGYNLSRRKVERTWCTEVPLSTLCN